MSPVFGTAFLHAPIRTMMDKLGSIEFLDYTNHKELNISLLQTPLFVLESVLDDAENKQFENQNIRQWLDGLKDAIYDAEDLLNQISYDSLRCKVTNQVRNFLSSPFNTNRDINSQIEELCERLQHFAQLSETLGLKMERPKVYSRIPTTSVINDFVTVGRKDDKKKLIKMLLSDRDTDNNDNPGVVAILGMGGLGKTTLAQLLYNDIEVQNHFDLKAWVCVSEDFDIWRLTKALLEAVTSRNWDVSNLDFLRIELKRNLRNKRFLFVLDDAWNDNYNDWDELLMPFVGKSGSKVIITTRLQTVAEVRRASHVYKLDRLSDEDSWSLLSKCAFGSEGFHGDEYPTLEAIGRRIARKCSGLPLAAKALGALLHFNRDAEHWNEILNSEIWQDDGGVLPALRLSYLYLPSHLKRCFAYCSIFPKDYPLDRKQLVLLWMAEGFIENYHMKEEEEIGDEFFGELISRSLIQQSNDDVDGKFFVMHDLINDLATSISGASCCRLEYGGNNSKNVRHLSYNREKQDISRNCEIFHDFKCLRSFLPIGPLWGQNCISRHVVFDLLPTLMGLRVLSLSKYRNLTKLPDSIGNLTQLRYLDLSNTRIKSLPNTTSNLHNLQTLILSYCYRLTDLPINIGGWINLRHLDISGTNIKELPMQIVELENLRTLTVFIVGRGQVGLSIKELRKFPHLQGKLTILNLHNVIDSMEALAANLKSKEHIEELVLQWGEQTVDHQKDKNVLDVLQPSINMKKMTIVYYGGKSFPSWLGDSSFSNMVYLTISNCEYCPILPPLGQLSSLKDLRIDGMRILKSIGPEFYGMVGEGSNSSCQPFPSLQNLQFKNMSSWKEWLPFEGNNFPFPCLQTLRLSKCPELRGHMPRSSHLPSIQQIIIIDCGRLLETPSTLHWLSSIENKNILYLK